MAQVQAVAPADLAFVAHVGLQKDIYVFTLLVTKCKIPVSLSCGGSSSENNTYIVQTATTSAPATPCTYKICPCSTDICRIRYEFTTNVLADPVLGTAVVTGDVVTTASMYK